jgi:hypothetical protein
MDFRLGLQGGLARGGLSGERRYDAHDELAQAEGRGQAHSSESKVGQPGAQAHAPAQRAARALRADAPGAVEVAP